MKKLLSVCCLISILVLSFVSPAKADVIIEPQDAFYNAHREECSYQYRRYVANGEEGYGIIWKSPDSSAQNEILPNGQLLSCHMHYRDSQGQLWGGAWEEDSGYLRGWINLSRDFAAVADHLSFEEARKEEFTDYDPAYDSAFEELKTVMLWSYPGSGEKTAEVEAEWFTQNSGNQEFQTCYLDPQGRFWAYVGYCYGYRDTWLCLSDPANPELPVIEGIIPDAVPAGEYRIIAEEFYPPAKTLPQPKSGAGPLAAALVAALVAVTAVLIPLLCPRKGKKEQPDSRK